MLAGRIRRWLRIAAYSALAFSGVTCTESPTAPGGAHGGRASLRLAPSFSVQSAAVYRTLGQFGLTVDHIHIHIDHPPATAFDTLIAVPAGADSLVLDLPVILNAPTEQLLVHIELLSGNEVLFSGTQTITATVGGTSSGPPPNIPIVYVGPGAGATHLAIAPRDTAIRVSGTVVYRYAATDDHSAPVSGVAVAWSTSDATLGSIDGNGAFTPSGKQGVTRIVAATPNGLRDSTTLTITAPPTRLVVVSGAGQTGTAGSALAQPLVVQAQTADGTPVPGVAVTFTAPATGTVNPTSALTDAAGRAQTTMTLGTTAGTQSFGAAAGGLTGATAAESATAAAAATLAKVSGDAQADSVGHALSHPFVVRVTDAFGNPVAGTTVDWTRVAGAGTLAAASSTSDSAGLASVGYTLGPVVRVDTVSAAVHGIPASAVLFTASGEATTAAAIAVVSGDAQSGTVATALTNPLVVKVTDAHGNAVAGAHVTWTVTTGSGTLTPPLAVTDSSGKAQTSFVFGATVGTYVVTASVGTSISTTFHEIAAAGVAAVMTKTAGDTQTVAASSAVPVKPTVKITDASKNPVAGLPVTFAVASGGGSVTGASVTTNAAGLATVGGWTVGATGAQSLHATSGSLSVTFTATLIGTTNRVASILMTPHLDTLTSLGDTYTLTAQAHDTANAVVADTFTWVSRVPATATVSSAGVVTSVANGSTWVVASDASGKQDSAQIVVQQRVATVNITPSARNIYLTRTYTLTAAAVDGRGHAMTGTPTFTWATNAPAVATVSSAGLVTGVGLGGAQISATTGSITGVATIGILTPITRIVVGRDSSALPVTDTTSLTSLTATRTFTAVAHDTLDAPMTGVTFTWTSTNGSVAVLDSITATTARATAAANGLTAITAVAQGITGSATLKVSQVLASIQLTPAADTIAVTGSAALVARGLDARGKFISGGTFTYTSGSPGVATVNASTGVVTGVTNGTAFITASSGSITSNQSTITVGGTVPAAISFGRDTLSVGRGSSASIPIYLSKPNAAPVTVHLTVGDTTAFWSSANVVIPAGQTAVNATLNGHNAGTTIVTAVDSSGTGYSSATAVLAVQASMKLTSTYYAINTTDQVNTQVLLSDPSPAGGTYVTFNYGTAGVAAVSPSPAFIPAGQLAADIQITAVDSGTTTITPTAIGVNGTASNFTAYGAWLRFNNTSIRLGAGQYEPSVYLYIPTSNNLPVAITLTSSDSTIAAVPHTVTIPGGSNYVYFTTTALATGTATITASAPGWTTTNSLAVLNTAPHVGICCGYALVTTSPAVTVAVYSEDSLKAAHYRTNSLVVRLHSTDTTVMKVLDSVVTIAPGTYYNGTARVIPGGLGGSAYIVASASGHTSDSTQYTVTGPKLALSWTANRLGLGQQDVNLYVYTPNAVTSPLVVNLLSADTSIVGVQPTVTIPQGSNYAYFNVRGNGLGTMPIIASAIGYQADTATYTVTTPRVVLSGGTTLNNFGPAQGIAVYSEDSVGSAHYRMTPLTVSLSSSDTTVLRSDSSSVTIAAGLYYANTATVTPTGVGTAKLYATAAGQRGDSNSFTVQTPKLNLTLYNYTIGKGQHRSPTDFYAYTPNSRPTPVTVTFTQKHAAVDSLTATSLTIPAASNYQYFSFFGLTKGADTIVATATGYLPDTAYVTVTTPKLATSGLPGSTTTTNPPFTVNVYAEDSITSSAHYVSDTLVIAAVSSDTNVIRPAQPYFRIPKNAYYASTTVNIVGPGTASITYSDSAGTGYLPSTTNTVTVTGPSLALSTSSTVLGMRQTTGASGVYVYVPNAVATPLVVNLASTGTRVATVPASVTIAAGQTYAYFGVTALDTVGTIQIQATATGYRATSMTAQVTQPKFQIYTSGQVNTTSPKQGVTVYAEDANGTTHYTTENVTVTLASSSPTVASLDSTTVTIPAGGYYNNLATWSPGLVGTAQLSASDTRAAIYKYNTGTVNTAVINPSLTLGNFNTLGIGQYADNYFYVSVPDNQVNPLTVTLAHPGTARTTAPASVVIPAGSSYAYFRVIGASAGTDTLVASASSPFHNPATAYTVVDSGRIDPLGGWPTSLSLSGADSVAITLYARDPSQNVRNVLAATTWTLTPNANIEFVTGGATSSVITSIAVPAGAQSVTFYVKALSAGTASATITAANYKSYTNTFTVMP